MSMKKTTPQGVVFLLNYLKSGFLSLAVPKSRSDDLDYDGNKKNGTFNRVVDKGIDVQGCDDLIYHRITQSTEYDAY